MRRMPRLYLSTLLFLLLASGTAHAMPEEPPPHSLSPQLSGLNISTYVKKDPIKIVLYVINHEKFEVLCDAQYRSGPDTQDLPEITIPAGKADAFRFTFGRRSESVLLNLICVDPRKQHTTATPAPDNMAPENMTPAEAVPTPETTTSPADDNPYLYDAP